MSVATSAPALRSVRARTHWLFRSSACFHNVSRRWAVHRPLFDQSRAPSDAPKKKRRLHSVLDKALIEAVNATGAEPVVAAQNPAPPPPPPPLINMRELPQTVPYSIFVYGSVVVEAAIHASQRILYKLYIYKSPSRSNASKRRDRRFIDLAQLRKVPVEYVEDATLLDRVCMGRPHNGYVLECSDLPWTMLSSLLEVPKVGQPIKLAKRATKIGVGRGHPNAIPCRDPTRFPLVVMLEGVVDPQNIGAIIRTAYFLGCEAAIVTANNGYMTAAAIKASAGGSEYLPVLRCQGTLKFMRECKANGWAFIATMPPLSKSQAKRARYMTVTDKRVGSMLREAPTVLVLGNEGDGLRDTVRESCTSYLGVARTGDSRTVDSLNVSVATGIVCHALIAKHKEAIRNMKLEEAVKAGKDVTKLDEEDEMDNWEAEDDTTLGEEEEENMGDEAAIRNNNLGFH